jgi:hypothetical protein
VIDLALADELLDSAGHVLDRYIGIDAVLVKKYRCDRFAGA